MSKYYIITKGLEGYFDWELYYDEYMAEQDQFALIERHDFPGMNTQLYKDILADLEQLYDDLQEDPDYDEEEDNYTEEEALQGIIQIVNDDFTKADKTPLTLKEVVKLIELAEKYYDGAGARKDKETELMCEYLEIQYGKPFQYGIMRGSSQGDGVYYICPQSLSDEYLKYIEAVIMADGMFAYITDKPIDDPVKELSDDLSDDFYDEYYLPGMSDQVLKDYFAKKLGISITNIEVIDEDEYKDILQAQVEENEGQSV